MTPFNRLILPVLALFAAGSVSSKPPNGVLIFADDQVLTAMDVLPTFAKLSGARLSEGLRWKSWKLPVIDGKDALYSLDKDMKANVRPADRVENPKPLLKKEN